MTKFDKKKKPQKMTLSEFGELTLRWGVSNRKDVEQEAEKRRRSGDTEMWTFSINRGQKVEEETIAMVNSMTSFIEAYVLLQRTRLRVLGEGLLGHCGCPEDQL